MNRMIMLGLVVIVLIVVIGTAIVASWRDTSPPVAPTAPVVMAADIGAICRNLPKKEGSAVSHYEVVTYANARGEVGGYAAYDPEVDGGTIEHFDAEGTFVGSWGLVISPDNEGNATVWSHMTTQYPERSIRRCDR